MYFYIDLLLFVIYHLKSSIIKRCTGKFFQIGVFLKYILPSYLLKDLFKTFVPAFCGFGFLIILGLTIQLLHKGLDIVDIRAIIPYLMLFACPDALPISFLAATVMSYGRMSGSNEIVAIRTSGVHLHVIVTPVLVIAFLLSFITLYLNAEVLPNANSKIKRLKETAVSSVVSKRISTVKKKIVFEPYHIYIGNVEDDKYKNLVLIEYFENYVTNILLAEEGTIVISDDGSSLVLTLENGDFAKMNYQKPVEIPRIGNFDEMSFEIPIKKDVLTTSKKYKTLFDLYKDRKEMIVGIDKYIENVSQQGKEEFSKTAKKELEIFKQKYNSFIDEQKNAEKSLGLLESNRSRNKSRLESVKNEIDTIENHIAISNLERDYFGNPDQVGEDQPDNADETEDDYLEKKKAKENELITLRENIESNEKELRIKKSRVLEIDDEIENLKKSSEKLINYLKFESMQNSANGFLLLIHKRLSSSFLCITFALIGIPLGILTKSGNILIGFGVSFLLVILIYYPLSVVGLMFAEDLLPIIPSVWAGNIVIAILGIVLFIKSLSR